MLKGLPSNVWLIGLVSLCNDAASDLIYPLVPLYLSSVLMAGPQALGLIEGIAEATASLLKLVSGVMMDRTRSAKPWILVGYAMAGLGRPLIAIAGSWLWVLAIRFVDRIGKGLRTSPRDALLANSVPAERRGVAFGLHRAMDNAGAVIGPVVAALLLAHEVPLRDIFLWSLAPGLLTLALAVAIREPPSARPDHPPAFSWSLEGLPPAYKRYLCAVAVFTLGNSSNMFLLLRASDLGLAQAQVPLLWAVVSATAALLSTHLSGWSDRLGRVRFMLTGWSAYAAFYLGLGFLATDGVALFVLFALYGVVLAATEGVERALVADLAPEALRGTAFGWFNLVLGLFLLPASMVFGALYQSVSALSAFAFSAGCAIAATLLLRFWVFPSGRLPVSERQA